MTSLKMLPLLVWSIWSCSLGTTALLLQVHLVVGAGLPLTFADMSTGTPARTLKPFLEASSSSTIGAALR